jgi:hypothetical protein
VDVVEIGIISEQGENAMKAVPEGEQLVPNKVHRLS